MKPIFLSLLSLLFITTSFSQDEELKTFTKKDKKKPPSCRDARFARVADCANTVYYEEGANAVFHKKSGKPYTGQCKTCWGNDNIEMNITFANGKTEGKDTVYYENGQINLVRSHFQGKEDGEWMLYTDQGKLKWSKNYNGGQEHGFHTHYFPNGTVYKIEEWTYGKLTGNKKVFFMGENGEEGRLQKEVSYKDGKFHGMYITYFKNGLVESEQNYDKGQKDGLSKYYYDNGELFYTENYDKGKKNGQIKRLYPNGKTWIIEKYKDDVKTGTWEEYFLAGMIKYEGIYKKGIVKAEHYYNEDGDEMASPNE